MDDLVRRLHGAADRIWAERNTPEMDGLVEAIGVFLRETDLNAVAEDGGGEEWVPDPQSVGYGAMLGWLARG